jgi:hypothetical protein
MAKIHEREAGAIRSRLRALGIQREEAEGIADAEAAQAPIEIG